MDTLINNAILSREAIADYQTVLSLMWLDAANMEDSDKAEAAVTMLLRTC